MVESSANARHPVRMEFDSKSGFIEFDADDISNPFNIAMQFDSKILTFLNYARWKSLLNYPYIDMTQYGAFNPSPDGSIPFPPLCPQRRNYTCTVTLIGTSTSISSPPSGDFKRPKVIVPVKEQKRLLTANKKCHLCGQLRSRDPQKICGQRLANGSGLNLGDRNI